MALSDFLKGLFSKSAISSRSQLDYQANEAGLYLRLPPAVYAEAVLGRGDELSLHQFLRMQMLLEEGVAQARPDGLWLEAADAAALDADSRYVFNLPAPWPGQFRLETSGLSTQPQFSLALTLLTPSGEVLRHYRLQGPLLKLGESDSYLLDSVQWQALAAIAHHQSLPPTARSEYENLAAVHGLMQAALAGLAIDTTTFRDFQIQAPTDIGLAIEVQPDGSLILEPSFGEGLAQTEVAKRLGQLRPDGGAQSLRIGKTLVLLDEARLKAAHEIIRKRHIPANQRRQFFAAPGSFLDASLIRLDSGFSLRIKGAAPFQHAYFGETGGNDIDWFNQRNQATALDAFIEELGQEQALLSPDELPTVIRDLAAVEDLKQRLEDALATGASVLPLALNLSNGHVQHRINISEPTRVRAVLAELERSLIAENAELADTDNQPYAIDIHLNDAELEYGQEIHTPNRGIRSAQAIDFNAYTRQPFPHQIEGIRWMLALATNEGRPDDAQQRIHGALLADDMGLGKTYMAIVGIREILQRLQNHNPVLVVAPLSLLENWKREVESTYCQPLFKRIVTLQADGDLPQFRIGGMGVEIRRRKPPAEAGTVSPNLDDTTAAPEVLPWEELPTDLAPLETATPSAAADAVGTDDSDAPFFPEYALKLGPEWGLERLDLPDTLVLTTYQTLRDYQFSLASVPWSLVIFDEAQNIKSPNTLQTRAAKALSAAFKLLVTGTPVENHLGEFWCLFDTLQPGFLGSYQDFRHHYIKPILKAPPDEVGAVREEIGEQLRERVGGFMLRRLKEDHLPNMPKKYIVLGEHDENGDFVFDARIHEQMQGEQRNRYEDVMNVAQDKLDSERNPGTALLGLQQLRDVSLHPALLGQIPPLPLTPAAAREFFQQSGKLGIVLRVLDEVRERGEKVLIFIVNKRLQELVSLGLNKIYGVPVAIINGATKAVSKNPLNPTRQVLIDHFQATPGFGILVISPVAAGVGLTITAANNVIHLERHWNPAKEAQATDRAYRIGQQKDVYVYIPILAHPDFDSFDVNLNRLLSGKTSLKDAIITQEEVQAGDFVQAGMFSLKRSQA
jgi:SNF2 family DNA or RNA helicase